MTKTFEIPGSFLQHAEGNQGHCISRSCKTGKISRSSPLKIQKETVKNHTRKYVNMQLKSLRLREKK
jgi:hypothetical protein